jgi:hypothetical protein
VGRNVWIAGVVGFALVAFLVAIADDAGEGPGPIPSTPASAVGGSDPAPSSGNAPSSDSDFVSNASQGSTWVSTHERVLSHEALPCTGPEDPINFEIFSAGPAVAGLPLTGTVRRCDPGAPVDEEPSNYVAYVYGECEIAEGATGCELPLQVHSWPACQRALADYSFEGKPLPYEELPTQSEAKVVEIDFFAGNRIEVYTGSSTVVIFASDPAVARKAVEQLSSQGEGEPPVTRADVLGEATPTQLEAPSDGAMEGDLSCQS